ncbi:MAG: hypothetical protein NZ484_00005, partial [Patescibacteria group bacterium]|nr:hypothetical protein [Patescibacteria group bacterium]
MNQKLIFIIVLTLFLALILGLGSYFGLNWYQNKLAKPIQPKIVEYGIADNPRYFPNDFSKIPDFKILSTKEITYSDNLIITEQSLESNYSFSKTLNLFKDYLNNNLWQIVKEYNIDQDPNQIFISAKREGYLIVMIKSLENKSLVLLRYEYNPLNPLKPEPKQVFKELPSSFPQYLIFSKAKIGGYSEDVKNYSVILFSEETNQSLYDFYLNVLQRNNWKIVFKNINNFSSDIVVSNLETGKLLKIQILPK